MLMGSYALICAEIHLAVRTGNAYDWLDDVKEAFETRENFLFFCKEAWELGFSAGKKRGFLRMQGLFLKACMASKHLYLHLCRCS